MKAEARALAEGVWVLEEQIASAKAMGHAAVTEYKLVLASFGGTVADLPEDAPISEVLHWMSLNFLKLRTFVGSCVTLPHFLA